MVLPRLQDLTTDVVELAAAARQSRGGERIYLSVVDFEDAFYSLGLHPTEWPFLLVKHPTGGFANFRTALCGGAAFPLVWGRGQLSWAD